MVLLSKRALNEAGGDERESDGDVTGASGDKTLRDALIDEGLVGVDERGGGGLDVIDAELLGELGADIAGAGLVDGVELEVDHDLRAAVDEVGEGEVHGAEDGLGRADDQSACTVLDGDLLEVKDVADNVE